MKIIFVGSAKSIHVRQWISNLTGSDVQIVLVTQHPDDTGFYKDFPKVKVVNLPNFFGLGYILNVIYFKLIVLFEKPDLVNVHYATGYGFYVHGSGGVPCVLNVWGSDVYEFPLKSKLHKCILRLNLLGADLVASTSRAMANQVESLYPDICISAITPFGVSDEFYLNSKNFHVDNKIIFGTVKTLHEKYGIDFLIRAFAMFVGKEFSSVAEAEAYVTLRLVGGGDKAALVSLCQQLGIVDIVEFVGAVPHSAVPSELSLLDIYCAPSRQESFGVAVIEASSCGVPVIVSDAGGLPEVVVHGQTGFITPVGDIEAICAAMQRLYHDRTLRETMGKNGRDFVVKNYSWQVCTQKMLNTYKKAIES